MHPYQNTSPVPHAQVNFIPGVLGDSSVQSRRGKIRRLRELGRRYPARTYDRPAATGLNCWNLRFTFTIKGTD